MKGRGDFFSCVCFSVLQLSTIQYTGGPYPKTTLCPISHNHANLETPRQRSEMGNYPREKNQRELEALNVRGSFYLS